MRFDLAHPVRPRMTVSYGWDEHLGWWAEVRGPGRNDTYDELTTPGTTPSGVLQVLLRHGFITEDHLRTAADALAEMLVEEIEDADVRRAAEVIQNLRTAADGG